MRIHFREFLDGIVRPIGAICGVAVLLILEKFFIGESLILYVNIAMLVVSLFLFYVTYIQQHKYTEIAIDDLKDTKSKEMRMDAIEILAQKGHKFPLTILTHYLNDKEELISIRVKILRAFAEMQDISVIDEMPLGPRLVETFLVSADQKEKAYDFLKEEIQKKRQGC